MLRVGIVGWRGMVGSVLVQRMREERDFDHVEPVFFSTSQAGGQGPAIGKAAGPVKNATDVAELKKLPVIISCQGGDYTSEIYPKLRSEGWKGYWIDAASTLRMKDDAIIILDPVNMGLIKDAVAKGTKDFIGGNCTVSLMLMGMAGLFQRDEVEWMTSMTYQAASGQGAAAMRDLVAQMAQVGSAAGSADERSGLRDPRHRPRGERVDPLAHRCRRRTSATRSRAACSPWIDKDLGNGQSREEWKAQAEANKILGRNGHADSDGRHLRAHRRDALPQPGAHHQAAPAAAAGRDRGHDRGRARLGESGAEPAGRDAGRADPGRGDRQARPCRSAGCASCPWGTTTWPPLRSGDQLLWGAAEPLRRMLRILLDAGVKQ